MFHWHTESFRVTVFLNGELLPDSDSWWQSVAGTEPEITSRTRQGVQRSFGPILDGEVALELLRQPNRVDWNFAPLITADRTIVRLPSLGPPDVFLKSVREMLSAWLSSLPSATSRLAVGTVLRAEAEDRATGYARLQQLLPLHRLDLEGVREFMLQLNRPRVSKVVPAVEINRLSKWSVAAISGLQVAIGGDGDADIRRVQKTTFANRLELDINTSGDLVELPGDLVERFDELSSLAIELAANGDVK